MTREPAPVIGKDTAFPIAQNHGQVMIFSHSVRNLAGFVIAWSGTPAFVRMWNVQCLHSPPEKIERISGLKSAYSGEFRADRSPANSGRIPGTGFSGSSMSKRPVLLSSNLTGS